MSHFVDLIRLDTHKTHITKVAIGKTFRRVLAHQGIIGVLVELWYTNTEHNGIEDKIKG